MTLVRSAPPRPPHCRPPSGFGLLGLAALVLALIAAPAALGVQPEEAASADPRVDPATGRDMRVWPPDLPFDYQRLRLEVEIPDMDRAYIRGRCTITLTPVAAARSSVRLDVGPALSFSSVTVGGVAAEFVRDTSAITVQFPRPIAPGDPIVLILEYDAENPGGRGEGLTFSKDDPRTPEHDPMCHAQGQPQSNHLWFPCLDFPNYRLATEVIATVPAGYTAVSNGALVEVRKNPAAGTWRYHWNQDLPHAVYLVTLVVGRFDVVDVGGPETARPGLWMPVYGPLGSAEVLKRNFGNTPDMIAYFEGLFDEPFPWDKYANIICRDFAAGAMENTSAVTWASFAATSPQRDVEPVNAHELVHQWFGNLLTCKSWEHLWLNEGWASFGEALWAEHTRGGDAYRRSMAQSIGQVRARARGVAPHTGGMATNLYEHPDDRFYSPDNVYAKGAWVLHSLRHRLGDDVFWAGVRLYIDRHKFSQVETDDFRFALEEVSGQSLERFFDQFVVRPGIPRLGVDLAWDDAASALNVTVRQTQAINADNPAYALSLPILVESGEDHEYVWVDIDTRETVASFHLDRKPTRILIDPAATVVAESRITTDLAALTDQPGPGPMAHARVADAESLDEAWDLDAAPASAFFAEAD